MRSWLLLHTYAWEKRNDRQTDGRFVQSASRPVEPGGGGPSRCVVKMLGVLAGAGCGHRLERHHDRASLNIRTLLSARRKAGRDVQRAAPMTNAPNGADSSTSVATRSRIVSSESQRYSWVRCGSMVSPCARSPCPPDTNRSRLLMRSTRSLAAISQRSTSPRSKRHWEPPLPRGRSRRCRPSVWARTTAARR